MHLSRIYIYFSIIATICAIASLCFVIVTIDPFTASGLIFVLFFFSLFLSILGGSTLIGIWIRRILDPKQLMYRQVSNAFRQGFLFASLSVVSLILEHNRYLTWWLTILLVACFACVDYFIGSYKSHIYHEHSFHIDS